MPSVSTQTDESCLSDAPRDAARREQPVPHMSPSLKRGREPYGFSGINLCVRCKVDMGDCNDRQYCGKWRCDAVLSDDEE